MCARNEGGRERGQRKMTSNGGRGGGIKWAIKALKIQKKYICMYDNKRKTVTHASI